MPRLQYQLLQRSILASAGRGVRNSGLGTLKLSFIGVCMIQAPAPPKAHELKAQLRCRCELPACWKRTLGRLANVLRRHWPAFVGGRLWAANGLAPKGCPRGYQEDPFRGI